MLLEQWIHDCESKTSSRNVYKSATISCCFMTWRQLSSAPAGNRAVCYKRFVSLVSGGLIQLRTNIWSGPIVRPTWFCKDFIKTLFVTDERMQWNTLCICESWSRNGWWRKACGVTQVYFFRLDLSLEVAAIELQPFGTIALPLAIIIHGISTLVSPRVGSKRLFAN